MAFGTRLRRTGRVVLLAAGLFATFVVFFLASMRVAVRAREVAVPDLRGKTVSEATSALAGVGLTLKVEPLRRPDATVPADHVLSQDPGPGVTLRRQRSIRVQVSDGVRAPLVPAVAGQSERAAQLQLAQDQITIASVLEVRLADAPPDTVVAQDPLPPAHSATVTLLVNRGQTGQTYVMPDLIGTRGSAVLSILRARDFRVSVVAETPYPGLPAGIVIKQTPQAGFQIAHGEPIALEVSR
jgi:serine/threonine-protein kinase